MKEYNAIELEGKEYIIVKEINFNNVTYVYLANSNNPKDFCIRKVINKDNSDVITGLDSDKEFTMALRLFSEKDNTFQQN